jgi:centrosomal protein CEP89
MYCKSREFLVQLSNSIFQGILFHSVDYSYKTVEDSFHIVFSATVDEILHKKQENIEILKAKLSKLEANNKHLEEQRDTYKTKLEHIKSQKEIESEETAALQAQNQELNEDVTLLKNLVYRLNVELDRYQQKLHKQGNTGDLPPLKVMSSEVQEKEATVAWMNINKSAVGPLLEAYQETIKEKDDLIHNYEQDLNKFVANCKQVVAENEKLYQDLEEANKQVGITFVIP